MAAISDQCRMLPGLSAWTGQSHDAAEEMFERAKRPGAVISDVADDLSGALKTAFYSLSTARICLLNEVSAVEKDDLVVNASWVVLLKPVAMNRDRAEELKKLQTDAQGEVNRLLVAVGDADAHSARALIDAAAVHGFVMPQAPGGLPGILVPGFTSPANEVPDPRNPMTLLAQLQAQQVDAAVTVAETTTSETAREKVTTVVMQDGSTQVISEWNRPSTSDSDFAGHGQARMPEFFFGYDGVSGTSVSTYDPEGNLILRVSEAISDRTGAKVTNIKSSNGAGVVGYQDKDGGNKGGWEYNPDGSIKADLPPDAPFFSHPILTATGGLLSGVQNAAEGPEGLKGVGKETSSKIAVGAKWGGPALSVATTIYDMATADGQYATCRALYSGTFGTAAGIGGGIVGGIAGAPSVWAAPVLAGAASMTGTWIFAKLGDEVGQIMCAR